MPAFLDFKDMPAGLMSELDALEAIRPTPHPDPKGFTISKVKDGRQDRWRYVVKLRGKQVCQVSDSSHGRLIAHRSAGFLRCVAQLGYRIPWD